MKPSLYSSRGMSVVEGLLALAIVSVVALSAVSTMRVLSKDTKKFGESCRLYNISVLQRIRNIGVVNDIANFLPIDTVVASSVTATKRTITPANKPFDLIMSESPTYRWPAVPILDTDTSPKIFNSILISGYMNTLQSLYNSMTPYCSDYQTLPDTGTPFVIPPPASDDRFKLGPKGIRVKIVPYNINDGTLQACTKPRYPVPMGKVPDNASGSIFVGAPDEKMATRPPGADANIGFAVSVQTQYEIESGQYDTCITEERFQYHTDSGAGAEPLKPVVTMQSLRATDLANLTWDTDLAICSEHSKNKYILTIEVPSASEPGVVLLCRNRSVMPSGVIEYPIPGYTGYAAKWPVKCTTGRDSDPMALPGPQLAVATGPSYYGSGTYVIPKEYVGFSYGFPPSDISGWVPCDKMQLCNYTSPTTVTAVGAAATSDFPARGTSYGYQLEYDNLASGCRIRIEVAAVDTGSNPSEKWQSGSFSASEFRQFINPVTQIGTWDVPRPRCREYCGVWPDGYFTCRTGGCVK